MQGDSGPDPPSCPGAFLFYLGEPSVSAVRVAWPATTSHPPLTGPPRLLRAADLHRRVTVPSPSSRCSACGTRVPASNRTWVAPGGGIGDHQELAVGEAVRAGVRGEVGADDLRPAAEDRAERGRGLPALVPDEAAGWPWSAAAGRPRRGRRGDGRPGRSPRAGGRLLPRPSGRSPRGPGVRLRPGERFPGQLGRRASLLGLSRAGLARVLSRHGSPPHPQRKTVRPARPPGHPREPRR